MHIAYHQRISRQASARRVERSRRASSRLQKLRMAKEHTSASARNRTHANATVTSQATHRSTNEEDRYDHAAQADLAEPEHSQPSAEQQMQAEPTHDDEQQPNHPRNDDNATGVSTCQDETQAALERPDRHPVSSVGTSALSENSSNGGERRNASGIRALDAVHSALDAIPVLLNNDEKPSVPTIATQAALQTEQRTHGSNQQAAAACASRVPETLWDVDGSDDDNDDSEMHEESYTAPEVNGAEPALPSQSNKATLLEKLAALRQVLQVRRRRFEQDAQRCVSEWRRLNKDAQQQQRNKLRSGSGSGRDSASSRARSGNKGNFEVALLGGLAERVGQQAILRAWSVNSRLKTQATQLVDAMHLEHNRALLQRAMQGLEGERCVQREKHLTADDARECYNTLLRKAALAHWLVFGASERFERAASEAALKFKARSCMEAWSSIARVTTAQLQRAAGNRAASSARPSSVERLELAEVAAEERDTMRESRSIEAKRRPHLRYAANEQDELRVAGKNQKAERLKEAISCLKTHQRGSEHHMSDVHAIIGELAALSQRLGSHVQLSLKGRCTSTATSLADTAKELCSSLQFPSRQADCSEDVQSVNDALTALKQGEIALLSDDDTAASSWLAEARMLSEGIRRSRQPPPGVAEALERAEELEQELKTLDAQLWSSTNEEDAKALRGRRNDAYARMRDAITTAEELKDSANSAVNLREQSAHTVQQQTSIEQADGNAQSAGVLRVRPRDQDGIADLHWFRRLAQRILIGWSDYASLLVSGRENAERLAAIQPAGSCLRRWSEMMERRAANAELQALRGLRGRGFRAWRAHTVRRSAAQGKGSRLAELRQLKSQSACLHVMQESQQCIAACEFDFQNACSIISRVQGRCMLNGWRIEAAHHNAILTARSEADARLIPLAGRRALEWLSTRARNRLLLKRVLNKAVKVWEASVEDVPHAEEFHMLQDGLRAWTNYAHASREERVESALATTADGYYDVLLKRRVVHSLRDMVDEAQEEAAQPLVCALQLRLWRAVSKRQDCARIRRKLLRSGWRNAHHIWIRRLLEHAFTGLRHNGEVECEKNERARAFRLRRKAAPAFASWRAEDHVAQALRWCSRRTMHECARSWHDVCKANALHRELLQCKAWRAFKQLSIAAAQRKHSELRRRRSPRRKLSRGYNASSTSKSAAALMARRALLRRRCLTAWHESLKSDRKQLKALKCVEANALSQQRSKECKQSAREVPSLPVSAQWSAMPLMSASGTPRSLEEPLNACAR
jgi:hypothetical protein